MSSFLFLILIIGYLFRGNFRQSPGRKFSTYVQSCLEAGIISREQSQQILEHLDHKFGARRLGRLRIQGVGWLALLAGVCVISGVILLISHNWAAIPVMVKLGAFWVLWIGVAYVAHRYRDSDLPWGMVSEAVWFFLPIAGIGLYAQIFQLSGDSLRSLLVWMVMAAPVVFLSRHWQLAALQLILGTVLLLGHNFDTGNSLSLVSTTRFWNPQTINYPVAATAWMLSLLIWVQGGALCLYKLKKPARGFFSGLFLFWLNLLLFFKTPLWLEGGWLLVSGAASVVLWFCLLARQGQSAPERYSARILVLFALYSMTFLWHFDKRFDDQGTVAGLILVAGLFLLATVLTLRLPAGVLSRRPQWQRVAQGVLLVTLVLGLAGLAPELWIIKGAGLLANFILAGAAVGLMWHGTLYAEMTQINSGVAILFLLVVTRFLDVFGGFVRSGVGFIVTGLVLAGLAYLLQRGRHSLVQRMQQGTSGEPQ